MEIRPARFFLLLVVIMVLAVAAPFFGSIGAAVALSAFVAIPVLALVAIRTAWRAAKNRKSAALRLIANEPLVSRTNTSPAQNESPSPSDTLISSASEQPKQISAVSSDIPALRPGGLIESANHELFPLYKLEGVLMTIHVYSGKVALIPRKRTLNRLAGTGAKTIPFASICAIDFREAGSVLNGYIRFTLIGGSEGGGVPGIDAAAKDGNSFFFSGSKNNELAATIRNYIETAMMHCVRRH